MDRLILLFGIVSLGPSIVTAVNHAVNVSETDGNGTVLWHLQNYKNCSLNGTKPATDNYFRFDAQHGQLVLEKPLDLEVIGKPFSGDVAVITVEMKCETQAFAKVNISVSVLVSPENEFRPEFQQAPYSIELKEEIPKGTTIFTLRDKVIDRDVMKFNQVVSFDVHPYLIGAMDGRRYFSVDNQTGEVTTTSELDYETLERYNFFLNITATDNGGIVSFPTTLNVNITDIDDMSPEFRNPGTSCGTICSVQAYSHVIDIHYQGLLDKVTPSKVFARDGDLGIAAKINYSIDYDPDDEFESNIAIDDVTGVLQVLVPYDNFTNVTSGDMEDPFFITVTIVATELSANRRSANASFTLTVYRVLPTLTPPSTQPTSVATSNVTMATKTKEDDSGTSAILLIEILVPCCISVAVLVAVIIVTLLKRQKQKEMKYKVKEKEKETRHQSDMMESLPATMASPYDLVGAYAHIDLGTYDQRGVRDVNGAPVDSLDIGEYNGVVPADFDNLYTKVKRKAPRQAKLRAVDIVEADLGDGDDGEEDGAGYDGVQQGGYTVQDIERNADEFETNATSSKGEQLGGYVNAEDFETNVKAEFENGLEGNEFADNDWPEFDNGVSAGRHGTDSD